MTLLRFLGWVALAVGCVVQAAEPAPELPSPVANSCPAGDALESALNERITFDESMRDRLAQFVAGSEQTDVLPATLFVVNLRDEQAVARRAEQLRSFETNPDGGLSQPTRDVIECAGTDARYAEAVSRLRQVEAAVNKVRLQFLMLPLERRNALLGTQEAARRHDAVVQELETSRTEARQQLEQAERSIAAAQEQAREAASDDVRELAAQRTLIEKARQELAGVKEQLVLRLEDRTRSYRDVAQRLSLIAAQLNRKPTAEVLNTAYDQVASIWRELVDESFSRIADQAKYEPLPSLPAFPVELLQRTSQLPESRAVQTAYAEVDTLYQDLSTLRRTRYDEEREDLYRLLLQAGRLRSQLLAANLNAGNDETLKLTNEYVRDLGRELRVVPLRGVAFVYTKLFDFRHKIATGLSGIIDVIQQLALLALVIVLPFVAFRMLHQVTGLLNRLRGSLVQRHARREVGARGVVLAAALLIQRSALYVPWLIMLLVLWFADSLLARTDFSEITLVIPYITYYVIYRLLEVLLYSALSSVAPARSGVTALRHRLRLRHTTRRIGLFFLVSFLIAHATQDVVGEALIYRIVTDLMLYVGILVCAFAFRGWRVEIGAAAQATMPKRLGPRLRELCEGSWSWIACLPVVLLVLFTRGWNDLKGWLSQFDVAKRFAAELFRRRVEGAVGGREAGEHVAPTAGLPDDYLELFPLYTPSENAALITPSSGVVEDIVTEVRSWVSKEGENALAIHGAKGSGKSTLLRLAAHECESFAKVHSVEVPARLYSAAAVREFLNEALSATQGGDEKADGRIVVMLDEAHNLFLGAPGGFEGYRELQNILVETATTHFWCATFNEHSWNYLKGVFGAEIGWPREKEMPPFSEEDVRQLIMKHHHRASYALSFDTIISAAQNPDEVGALGQIETQFFRLLWGQSNGNPRAALVLWLSALRLERDGKLHVSIPQHRAPRALASLNEDQLFICAAVMRHENLSAGEIANVTQLPELTIRTVLRHVEDGRILFRSPDRRYRVAPLAQFTLTQMLVGRNFLYE